MASYLMLLRRGTFGGVMLRFFLFFILLGMGGNSYSTEAESNERFEQALASNKTKIPQATLRKYRSFIQAMARTYVTQFADSQVNVELAYYKKDVTYTIIFPSIVRHEVIGKLGVRIQSMRVLFNELSIALEKKIEGKDFDLSKRTKIHILLKENASFERVEQVRLEKSNKQDPFSQAILERFQVFIKEIFSSFAPKGKSTIFVFKKEKVKKGKREVYFELSFPSYLTRDLYGPGEIRLSAVRQIFNELALGIEKQTTGVEYRDRNRRTLIFIISSPYAARERR